MRSMDKTTFSVSMSVYGKDQPQWFQYAVDSILNQTLKPDEIVLVVDGPVPDGLANVIKHYAALPNFSVIWLEINQGHGNARRVGLANCSHELVALMDADDISNPTRFEKQIAAFTADSELSIVGGNITEFVGVSSNMVAKRMVPCEDMAIKKLLKKRCPFNQVTVMLRKSKVQAAGGYIDWYYNEDYFLWVRMFLHEMKFENIPENLVNVRIGNDMYKRRGGWRYFKSEARLQKFMLQNKVINVGLYMSNVLKRMIVQMLLPNKVRGWVFQKFAREKVSRIERKV